MFSKFRGTKSTPQTNSSEQNVSITPTVDELSEPTSPSSEFDDLDIGGLVLQPPPARFTISAHNRSFSGDDSDFETIKTSQTKRKPRSFFRSSHRSLSSIKSPQTSTESSPHPSASAEDQATMATLTGGKENANERLSRLDSWFGGTSEPVNIGLPVKEQIARSKENSRERSATRPNKLQRRSGPPSASATKSSQNSIGRLSFFNAGSKEKAIEALPMPADDILQLDVKAALQIDASADPSSSIPFKTRLAEAEALLLRMQSAYRVRTAALQDLQQEKEVQDEEVEGTETRVQHLKMQLAEMAEKAVEQEKAMVEMAESLAHERQLRREEYAARKKSISLVKAPPSLMPEDFQDDSNLKENDEDIASNDNISDSEEESSAESVFSHARDGAVSPTGTMLSSTSVVSDRASFQQSDISDTSSPYAQAIAQTIQPFHVSAARPPPMRQSSTFQKVLIELSAREQENSFVQDCKSCNDKGAPTVWAVAGKLKIENDHLKKRNGELERAVEDTLVLVSGLS